MTRCANCSRRPKREAVTDGLTGIASRKHFDGAFGETSSGANKNDQPKCMLMVDIDFFKKFNDSYGHQTGGLVLWLVVKPLEVCVR